MAQKVIFTVIQIMLEIYRKKIAFNPSFTFMGANTKYNDKRPDEEKANTKRYKSYKKILAIFFGRNTFQFIEDLNASIL
ncbi:hypothetical protein, partial [Pedobacter sp. HMWF019]|uniref:hypothetical protein n=1 Tax=Pedobacter sp. HMWF019 TaxID=2056856 RepID=UPI001304CA21